MKKSIARTILASFFVFFLFSASSQVLTNLKGCSFTGSLPKGARFVGGDLPGDEAQLFKDTIVSVVGIITGGEIILRAADSVKKCIGHRV